MRCSSRAPRNTEHIAMRVLPSMFLPPSYPHPQPAWPQHPVYVPHLETQLGGEMYKDAPPAYDDIVK